MAVFKSIGPPAGAAGTAAGAGVLTSLEGVNRINLFDYTNFNQIVRTGEHKHITSIVNCQHA